LPVAKTGIPNPVSFVIPLIYQKGILKFITFSQIITNTVMDLRANIVNKITDELVSEADPAIKRSGERFFREEVKIHGLRSGDVKKIAASHFLLLENKDKDHVFDICTRLWETGFMEEGFVACDWSYRVRKHYVKSDIEVFEEWVKKYITNWATCDTLCNHTVGHIVERYPENINYLKKWALSGNRWVKRAAAVSLIAPARKGLFRSDIFETADLLIADSDDMVQKGYGWMLKAASQADDVFSFVTARKKTMPRTAYRYAIEKMPPEMRQRAMGR
jgi:3-methyladenine DNA glycosylase AlkD